MKEGDPAEIQPLEVLSREPPRREIGCADVKASTKRALEGNKRHAARSRDKTMSVPFSVFLNTTNTKLAHI